MIRGRYFRSIFICLFITIIISIQAEPVPYEIPSRKVQFNTQENSSSLSEQATLSEEGRTKTLIRRSPTFASLNRRAPQGVGSPQAKKAAAALKNETKKVNQDLAVIENSKSSARRIKNAAADAIRQEKLEDGSRSILSKAAGNTAAVRKANQQVKKNGPSLVVGGFQKIENNPGNRKAVQAAVKQIDKGRVPVKKANQALIAAGTGQKNGRGGGGNSKPNNRGGGGNAKPSSRGGGGGSRRK